jgi:hypothetical protein
VIFNLCGYRLYFLKEGGVIVVYWLSIRVNSAKEVKYHSCVNVTYSTWPTSWILLAGYSSLQIDELDELLISFFTER